MEMDKYLIDTSGLNDRLNRRMPENIRQLPDREKCIRHLSHLINAQN